MFEGEGCDAESGQNAGVSIKVFAWPQRGPASKNYQRPGQERELFEKVAPAVVDARCGDDSWDPEQGEDEIAHSENDRARSCGSAELNRSVGDNLGSGGGVDEVTELRPIVIVVPSQGDEAGGQSRNSEHRAAEI